jgi:hypothetical protein
MAHSRKIQPSCCGTGAHKEGALVVTKREQSMDTVRCCIIRESHIEIMFAVTGRR